MLLQMLCYIKLLIKSEFTYVCMYIKVAKFLHTKGSIKLNNFSCGYIHYIDVATAKLEVAYLMKYIHIT